MNTEELVNKFMAEKMPFTYKNMESGSLMTCLANFKDWMEDLPKSDCDIRTNGIANRCIHCGVKAGHECENPDKYTIFKSQSVLCNSQLVGDDVVLRDMVVRIISEIPKEKLEKLFNFKKSYITSINPCIKGNKDEQVYSRYEAHIKL